MLVRSIVARKGAYVAWIRPDAGVIDACKLLAHHQVGALVVSHDGHGIDGILSERDIARSVAEHGTACVECTVADLMTSEVRTCRPDDTVDALMAVMTEHRVRHLPVLDDDGALAGIVSIGDVVKHRVTELEVETQTLHEYIESGR